jgi:hypothetical protein
MRTSFTALVVCLVVVGSGCRNAPLPVARDGGARSDAPTPRLDLLTGGVDLATGGPDLPVVGGPDFPVIGAPDLPVIGAMDSGLGADSGPDLVDLGGVDALAETCNLPCADGELCNAWTLACQPIGVPYPPPGQDNGGHCTTNDECRSFGSARPFSPLCITENGADYCVSNCTLPPDWGVPDEFERSDCPSGSVCFVSSQVPGATVGSCVPNCREDSECRTEDGYFCRRTLGGRTYASGYCAPAHCRSRGCIGFLCSC